jgi:hypothetical protein
VLVPSKHVKPILILHAMAGAYPREEDLKGANLGSMAFQANVSQGWKYLQGKRSSLFSPFVRKKGKGL